MRKLILIVFFSFFMFGSAFALEQTKYGNLSFPDTIPTNDDVATAYHFDIGKEINKGGRWYIGGQLGYEDLHYRDSWLGDGDGYASSLISIDDNGIAAGANAGYYINKFFAAEIGVMSSSDVRFEATNPEDFSRIFNARFQQVSGNFLLKIEMPLPKGINVFAKTGIAGVYRSNLKILGTTVYDSDITAAYALGGGVSYNLTDHFIVDATYMHYFEHGDLPSADYVTGGLSYLF